MAHRINVMIDDDVWERLKRIPRGKRSRLINQALEEHFRRERMREAFERLRQRASGKEPLDRPAEHWVRVFRDREGEGA